MIDTDEDPELESSRRRRTWRGRSSGSQARRSSVDEFLSVTEVPYTTWIARIQALPRTATSIVLDQQAAREVADKAANLISGFLDDGQPGAVSIYSYMIRQIMLKINDPGLKILFEPKSLGSSKCGDLLVRYQVPVANQVPARNTPDPVALALLEFKVRQPQSPPAQQLQNIKFVYQTYPETKKILGIEVTAGFATSVMELENAESPISHHAFAPFVVTYGKEINIVTEQLLSMIHLLYGWIREQVNGYVPARGLEEGDN